MDLFALKLLAGLSLFSNISVIGTSVTLNIWVTSSYVALVDIPCSAGLLAYGTQSSPPACIVQGLFLHFCFVSSSMLSFWLGKALPKLHVCAAILSISMAFTVVPVVISSVQALQVYEDYGICFLASNWQKLVFLYAPICLMILLTSGTMIYNAAVKKPPSLASFVYTLIIFLAWSVATIGAVYDTYTDARILLLIAARGMANAFISISLESPFKRARLQAEIESRRNTEILRSLIVDPIDKYPREMFIEKPAEMKGDLQPPKILLTSVGSFNSFQRSGGHHEMLQVPNVQQSAGSISSSDSVSSFDKIWGRS